MELSFTAGATTAAVLVLAKWVRTYPLMMTTTMVHSSSLLLVGSFVFILWWACLT